VARWRIVEDARFEMGLDSTNSWLHVTSQRGSAPGGGQRSLALSQRARGDAIPPASAFDRIRRPAHLQQAWPRPGLPPLRLNRVALGRLGNLAIGVFFVRHRDRADCVALESIRATSALSVSK